MKIAKLKIENSRRNFIPRNDSFTCAVCGGSVPPARGTFRNHCPACLTSRHVDEAVPGDRRASCHGVMPAIAVEGTDPDALDIVQRCERCGKVSRNRRAPDDDQEKLFALFAANLIPT